MSQGIPDGHDGFSHLRSPPAANSRIGIGLHRRNIDREIGLFVDRDALQHSDLRRSELDAAVDDMRIRNDMALVADEKPRAGRLKLQWTL